MFQVGPQGRTTAPFGTARGAAGIEFGESGTCLGFGKGLEGEKRRARILEVLWGFGSRIVRRRRHGSGLAKGREIIWSLLRIYEVWSLVTPHRYVDAAWGEFPATALLSVLLLYVRQASCITAKFV